MPSDDAVRQTSEATLIRTPAQLQQAKRPDAPPSVEPAAPKREASVQDVGILGQLETERAHD